MAAVSQVAGIAPNGHHLQQMMEIRSPLTDAVVGTIPMNTPDEVAAAVARARSAQVAWAALPFKQRAKVFIRYHDLIIDQREALFDLLQSESGKSRRDAFVEMFAVACEARYYAYHGGKFLKSHRVRSALPLRDRTTVHYKPVGVVGVISAWNFPFIFSSGDVIPALLAGNGVVHKPSHVTPLTSIWAREKMIECGLPADLLQIVTGDPIPVSSALVDHVDYVMFTGSTEVGRIIGQRAASRLIGCSLELGGKNAVVVLPDANIRHAAQVTIEGTYNNSGQVCINFERAYVHKDIYDKFVAELTRQASECRLGSCEFFYDDIGSMANDSQVFNTDAHLQDAVAKGAQVLYGGHSRPDHGPRFYEPTAITGVTPAMRVYSEETFGPILSIYKVNSADEAIKLANDSPFGLHHAVLGGNLRKAEKVAEQLEAGSVCVNDSYMIWAAMDAPMGGVKLSGQGRRHGPEGIRKYTEPQTVLVNRTPWQIGSYETPLAMNKRLGDTLALLLKLWRRIPFLR